MIIFFLIRLLLYHICEVPWAHTQEIILKNNSGEIRLFQVGKVHIMKVANKFYVLVLTNTVFLFSNVKMLKKKF